MSPLRKETENRLHNNSKSMLRRKAQAAAESDRDARIVASGTPTSSPPQSQASDDDDDEDDDDDDDADSVSSGPSEFVWGAAAETDIAEFLADLQAESTITSAQKEDLLHALREAEVETLGDLDFLALSRSSLLEQLTVVADGEEDAQPLGGAEQLWEALDAARTLEVSDEESDYGDGDSDIWRGRKRVPSCPPRLARLAKPKRRTQDRPPLAAAPITAGGLHVAVKSPWADSRVVDKRRSATSPPRAVSPAAPPRVADQHTAVTAQRRRGAAVAGHKPGFGSTAHRLRHAKPASPTTGGAANSLPWIAAAAASLAAPAAGVDDGSPRSVLSSQSTRSASGPRRRQHSARNYAAPTRVHALKTVGAGMAEHQFAEKGWAHGLRSAGTGRGAVSGFKSAHPRPAAGQRSRSNTRQRRAMSAPRERMAWDSTVSTSARIGGGQHAARDRGGGMGVEPGTGWQQAAGSAVREMDRRLQALESEVDVSGMEQYRLGQVLHPAAVGNKIDLGSTCKHGLRSDSLCRVPVLD
jgi:hypothetical protein